jgi:hypothetical protein
MKLRAILTYRVDYELPDGHYESTSEALAEERDIFQDEILILANREVLPEVKVVVLKEGES